MKGQTHSKNNKPGKICKKQKMEAGYLTSRTQNTKALAGWHHVRIWQPFAENDVGLSFGAFKLSNIFISLSDNDHEHVDARPWIPSSQQGSSHPPVLKPKFNVGRTLTAQ